MTRRIVRHTPGPRAPFLALLVLVGVLVASAVCLTWAGPAMADDHRSDHEAAMEAMHSGAVLPLRRILDVAQGQFTGEMLEAELDREHGAWVYDLEMITPRGSVLRLRYDAASGALLDGRGHGLMRAYKGDMAALPDSMRRRHEMMIQRRAEGGGGPGRWFRRLWGTDGDGDGDDEKDGDGRWPPPGHEWRGGPGPGPRHGFGPGSGPGPEPDLEPKPELELEPKGK